MLIPRYDPPLDEEEEELSEVPWQVTIKKQKLTNLFLKTDSEKPKLVQDETWVKSLKSEKKQEERSLDFYRDEVEETKMIETFGKTRAYLLRVFSQQTKRRRTDYYFSVFSFFDGAY